MEARMDRVENTLLQNRKTTSPTSIYQSSLRNNYVYLRRDQERVECTNGRCHVLDFLYSFKSSFKDAYGFQRYILAAKGTVSVHMYCLRRYVSNIIKDMLKVDVLFKITFCTSCFLMNSRKSLMPWIILDLQCLLQERPPKEPNP